MATNPFDTDHAFRLAASHHRTEYLRARLDRATDSNDRAIYKAALEVREVDGVGPAERTEVFHIIDRVGVGLCGEAGRVTKWPENADCSACLRTKAEEGDH